MAEPLPHSLRRWTLSAALACALPLLLLVPPWLGAVLLAAALIAGWSDRRWPAWLRLALTLMLGGLVLAAFGFRVGRDTSCAGLLALLMLKPFETHSRRDAYSLLGFSLFAPFAAFLQDQGPLTLSLSLPAVALSLVAWSLLLPGADFAPLAALRRTGFAALLALPVTFAGFWLFPRLPTPMWGLPENSVGSMGLGDRMTPNEWLDALVDDSAALRAHFLGRTPPRGQMYWRGPVLVDFDGEAWTRDPLGSPAEPSLPLAGAATYRYEVMLEPTERTDLPMLDVPTAAPPNARLNGELTAVTDAATNNLVRYEGRSAPGARYATRLSPRDRARAAAAGRARSTHPGAGARVAATDAGSAATDAALPRLAAARLQVHDFRSAGRLQRHRRIPVRYAPGLLPALQLRLRRVHAFGRRAHARGHWLRRRALQLDRRLLAAQAEGRARLERGVAGGRRLGARRPDRGDRRREHPRHARRSPGTPAGR
jgi:hypothetical protein